MSNLVELRQVYKSYWVRDQEIPVLRGLDFVLLPGQEQCILGASGSGKSTFLHVVGGIESVSAGEAFFNGVSWSQMSEEEKARTRAFSIGFVFQMHHLIRELCAADNVALPLRLRGESRKAALDKACYWLERVGLSHRLQHYPSELSGGELQRVCIARALVGQPQLLLADEPTGSLDSVHAKQIQDLLFRLREEENMALIVVTHDLGFASRFKKVLKMADGRWV